MIINREFPFKSGESFLENEINEVPDEFDQTFLFPIDISIHEEPTRKIKNPKVSTICVNKQDYNTRKISYTLKSFIKIAKKMDEHLNVSQKHDQYRYDAFSDDVSRKIIKEMEKMSFSENDEIVIYGYWLHVPAEIALRLKSYFQKKGIKSIAISRAHRFDIYEERKKTGYLPSRQYLLNNLDEVFPVSNDGKKYLKEKYSAYASKINCSRLGTYSQGLKKPSEKQFFHILSVSRVVPVKRIELLIEALSTWETNNVVWTHIGDGPELKRVKKMAQEKLHSVTFHFVGYKTNQEVYDYYKNNPVDVFVNVSSSEGIPVSMMEAISFGVPLVATDVGGNREIAVPGMTGYLINKKFPSEELIACLEKLKGLNCQEKDMLEQSVREFWQFFYQAQRNYAEFYEELLQKLSK
ncbi:glycosyltransferase [Enterococcus faecalis]|uniref:Glycosyltransferase, group 1 family protein n=1 Tax=Enterococcus faecalis RP2S-4 TaxID=1244145 RepID=A0ABC9TPU9_ENTFL|nr:glycosyltransferase [Enterococcus faecalis]EPI10423.1 glycosyltransferase, group 1 family protein [Enterococcus faecalis RP2S-4]